MNNIFDGWDLGCWGCEGSSEKGCISCKHCRYCVCASMYLYRRGDNKSMTRKKNENNVNLN